MRFVCNKAQAMQAIKDCKKVVSGKATQAVLQCVRIYVNGSVRFIGTDLDTFVEAGVVTAGKPAKGCAVVPLKMVEKVVAKAKAGDIVFATEKKKWDLEVSSRDGKQSFTVKGDDPENFPDTPEVKSKAFMVPGTALVGALKKAVFAVSDDEAQYYLNGVCMAQEPKKLTMVATDGHRLSRVTRPVTALPKGAKIIVGTKGVNAILSIFNDKESIGVRLSKDSVTVVFTQGKKRIAIKPIEGQFPDYEQVFPKKFEQTVSADVERLMEGIDTVSIMAGDNRRVSLRIFDKTIKIEASSEDGDAAVKIACAWSGKDAVDVGLNIHYALDYLKLCKQIGFNRATVNITAEKDGSVVKPTLWRQEGWEYLLMPMKIR